MTKTENTAPKIKPEPRTSIYDSTAIKTIRALTSYIGCIVITLGVMYFLDGTAGIILTYALACAFIVSLVMTLVVFKSISVSIDADKTLLAKDETFTCIVRLSKSLIMPAPIIEIKANCTEHLSLTGGDLFKGSLAGREVNAVKIPVKAKHSGSALITIEKITLTDFLGIFSFDLPVKEADRTMKISVYPDIPDAAVQTDFLKTTTKFQSNDDEEEESDENSIIPTGMPGYDHRQYFPGDPIKRINWKLSSKRDIYMIRLDEQICGAGQMFFLDCPPDEETDHILSVRDTVIEGALTMFMMLVREGREATFFYCRDGLWLSEEIHNMGDVYRIQEQLSDYSPCEPPSLIPSEIGAAGKTPICFTAATENNTGSAVQIANQAPNGLLICAEKSGMRLIGSNFWTISQEFEFRKQTV